MTNTPLRYQFEPPPQLYMGVDYRWDPLFFRIPSPRGPLTSRREENHPKLPTTATSLTINTEIQTLENGDKSPQRASHEKKKSCSRTRKPNQRDKLTEKKSESPSVPNVKPLRRGASSSALERHGGVISPRMSSKESPRHPPSSATTGTGIKKGGLSTRKDTLSLHRNDAPIPSPRLTRSAILRRDFNAREEPENKPSVSPRETNRLFLDSHRKTLGSQLVKYSFPATSGFSSQRSARTDTALGHSNYRTKLTDTPISPRGTKAADLRAAHALRKLDGLTPASVSVESPRQFVRTERVIRASLSTVDRNLNRNGDHLQRRDVPPVPEFHNILTRSRESKNMKAKSDVGKKENDKELSNKISVSIVELKQQKKASNQVVIQDSHPVHPVSDQENSSHKARGSSPVVIPMEDYQSSKNLSTLIEEEKPCISVPIENREEEVSLENVERDHNNGTITSQHDSVEVELKNQKISLPDAEVVLDPLSAVVREGTMPPVDLVEAVYSFSSSAFSEESDVTPSSVSIDEGDVLPTPPSYWRAETLPMVEGRPINSLPLDVSAVEDISSCVEKEKDKEGGCAPRVSLLPPISEVELAEKMSSIPRYILMGNVTPKVVKTARLTTSETIPKYMKLRENVRLHLMKIFFRNWLKWISRLSEVGFLKTQKVLGTNFSSSSFSPSTAGGNGNGGGVIANGILPPSERSEVVVELTLTPNESKPPMGAIATEQEISNAEEKKSPTLEGCDTSRQVTLPVREKSPPPLAEQRLEKAYNHQGSSENGVDGQTTVVDKKYSLRGDSSSFRSSSASSREEISAVEQDSSIAVDGNLPETDWLSVDFARPSTPVNYNIQEMESIHSHLSSTSRNSTPTLLEEDSQRTTDIEEIISNHNDHVNPPYRMKYLHCDL
ncbi:uncharacterized protein TM35_000441260 [Trypanosoma theileri]|uniref:Uncharacterized protein n=1 Tax=Trypanosoma theileri TaxID=67003 RepID=A0A1X0NK37_9TRYP|nr:uncharacterized protein TM35_000441260 [Trypanosoma theileri]ORC84470.1 hypothetical protein TM35_000441260 [Trypanosoma theileri]